MSDVPLLKIPSFSLPRSVQTVKVQPTRNVNYGVLAIVAVIVIILILTILNSVNISTLKSKNYGITYDAHTLIIPSPAVPVANSIDLEWDLPLSTLGVTLTTGYYYVQLNITINPSSNPPVDNDYLTLSLTNNNGAAVIKYDFDVFRNYSYSPWAQLSGYVKVDTDSDPVSNVLTLSVYGHSTISVDVEYQSIMIQRIT